MTFGILRTDGILRTGELPHHILHFADRDALGGAPNRYTPKSVHSKMDRDPGPALAYAVSVAGFETSKGQYFR